MIGATGAASVVSVLLVFYASWLPLARQSYKLLLVSNGQVSNAMRLARALRCTRTNRVVSV